MKFTTEHVGVTGNVHKVRIQTEVEILVATESESTSCPACRADAHGTAELTHSVAFGSVNGTMFAYSGETDSEEFWNNQVTVYYRNLPVLGCTNCFAWFTHPKVTSAE